jgi:hypothetical protein
MSDPIGQQLGQYQLTQLIHRRAMSAVYKAYQPSLDRFVAIKVLFSNGDPQFAMRFKRSARMSAGLQHPNILPTYDYGEYDNLLFIVLQYVEGGVTLDSMLGAPMELANAVLVMTRLLAALDYAHQRGIIHRDVKPANIMMSAPDWPLLGDFGIAKLRSDNQHFTASGLTIGTPAYMAPEQATGRTVDIRTDLYAAGLVFYTMLTGRVPFDAEAPMDMLAKHVYERPIPPRTLNPNIPIAAEQVVLQALEKLPAARYQSAVSMAEAIGELAPEVLAQPESPPAFPPQAGRAEARSAPAPAFVSPQSQGHLSNLYNAGVEALEAGRWNAAIALLSELVTRDPANDEAVDMLAAAREMQRRAGSQPAAISTGGPARATADEHTPQAHAVPDQKQLQPHTTINLAAAELAREQPVAEAPMRTCSSCGHEIRSDWSVCPYCRQTLSGISAVPAPGQSPPAAEKTAVRAPGQLALVAKEAVGAHPHTRRRIGRAGLFALVMLLGIGATVILALARRTPAPASPTAAPQAGVERPTAGILAQAGAPTIGAPTPTPAPTFTTSPTQAPTAQPSATAAASPTTPPAPTALPPDAVITIAQLRLRAGPSTNYGVQRIYPQGTQLVVLGKLPDGVWLNVRAPDGQIGWMRTSDLQVNIALDTVPIAEAPPSPTLSPTRRPTARPTVAPAPPSVEIPPTEPPTPLPAEPPTPTAVPAEPPTPLPAEPPTPTKKKEDKPRPTRKPSEPTPPK